MISRTRRDQYIEQLGLAMWQLRESPANVDADADLENLTLQPDTELSRQIDNAIHQTLMWVEQEDIDRFIDDPSFDFSPLQKEELRSNEVLRVRVKRALGLRRKVEIPMVAAAASVEELSERPIGRESGKVEFVTKRAYPNKVFASFLTLLFQDWIGRTIFVMTADGTPLKRNIEDPGAGNLSEDSPLELEFDLPVPADAQFLAALRSPFCEGWL